MVIWQADLNFNNEQQLPDARSWDAFPDYANALQSHALAFPTGGVLANFTRVETFGARNTHWVSARIDPNNPNLFDFEPRLVPGNQ